MILDELSAIRQQDAQQKLWMTTQESVIRRLTAKINDQDIVNQELKTEINTQGKVNKQLKARIGDQEAMNQQLKARINEQDTIIQHLRAKVEEQETRMKLFFEEGNFTRGVESKPAVRGIGYANR